MRKKITSILLALAIVLAMLPTYAAAAGDGCLQVSSDAVAAGDSVTLTYKVPNAVADVASISIKVGFDTSLFYEVTSVTYADGLGEKTVVSSTAKECTDAGEISSSWTNDDAEMSIAAGTTLFTAVLLTKDDVTGSAAFNVSDIAIADAIGGDLNDAAGVDTTAVTVEIGGEASPDEPAEDETKLVAPVIDPAGKTLKEDGDSVDITIDCVTSGAAIYYQLGDMDATLYTTGSAISLFTSGGAIYTSGGAINLGKSVVLKAWAMLGELKSETSATFEIKSSSGGGGGGGGSTPAPAEDAFPFKDVPANAYFRKAVEWAWKNGVTAGTTETTFSPYIGATRGQMVTYLWAAAGCPEPSSTDNPFTDVAEGAYYYKAVLWAVEKGITAGTSATTFSPDQTVTRGQAITFLYGAAGRPEGGSEPFVDVNEGDYFAAPVAWAYSKGITVGINETEFGPAEICQRCQIVQFLYLYYAAE